MKQIVIALVYGGQSTEHEVSLQSASSIHGGLLALGCQVHCIGIDRQGIWRYQGAGATFPGAVDLAAPSVSIRPGHRKIGFVAGKSGFCEITVDVLFPALHGLQGEDGTIQGLAAMCGLPCVGSGVLGSAVAMDKDFTKRLLKVSGISVTPWLALQVMPAWSEVIQALGGIIFVKPASSGSSIGVSRVTNAQEYAEAFAQASKFDKKVILEAEVRGREIECGILEVNGELVASELGEVIPLGSHTFYDYQAKYEDAAGARLCVPCCLPEQIKTQIQEISKRAFECLELKALARVDFFLCDDGSIYLNEVNTLPGFTCISMYPKMLECSGYPLAELVGTLVKAAVELEN